MQKVEEALAKHPSRPEDLICIMSGWNHGRLPDTWGHFGETKKEENVENSKKPWVHPELLLQLLRQKSIIYGRVCLCSRRLEFWFSPVQPLVDIFLFDKQSGQLQNESCDQANAAGGTVAICTGSVFHSLFQNLNVNSDLWLSIFVPMWTRQPDSDTSEPQGVRAVVCFNCALWTQRAPGTLCHSILDLYACRR